MRPEANGKKTITVLSGSSSDDGREDDTPQDGNLQDDALQDDTLQDGSGEGDVVARAQPCLLMSEQRLLPSVVLVRSYTILAEIVSIGGQMCRSERLSYN